MKKTKILFLSTAAFVLLFLVYALAVLRKDIQTLVARADKELKFTPVEVPAFSSLSVPANWKVKIKQGRDFKIELAAYGNASLKPAIEVIKDTAILKIDTTYVLSFTDTVYARVTMPQVNKIYASEGAHIRLENFTSDSVCLMLCNGVVFSGKNNSFKYVGYKTSGEVRIEITNLVAN
jgi:hypothetical protein